MYPSVDVIKLADHAKLFGVVIRDNFNVNLHVDMEINTDIVLYYNTFCPAGLVSILV